MVFRFVQILLHVTLAVALLQVIIRSASQFPRDSGKCKKLALHPDGQTYVDFTSFFHPSLQPYVSEIPESVLFPINITPTFISALEDFWGTAALDLFSPTFLTVYAWLAVQAVTERTGGSFIPKLLIFAAPLTLTVAQLITIAVAFNVIAAPAFILLFHNTRVKRLPSASRLSAIAFSTLLLYGGSLFLFGQSKPNTLWAVTLFQFLPIVVAFLYYLPFSIIAGLPFTVAFDSNDKSAALRKFWYFVAGLASILHVGAVFRLLAALLDYDNAPSYGLPRVASLPRLNVNTLFVDIFSVKQISDMGRVVLSLDYLVLATALLIMMTFGTGAVRGSRGLLAYLPQIIFLGPGAAFSFWMAENAEVPLKSD
ncbi:hypothetical protein PROFUN_03300 [Planoprotostelium fungivorum]|uniref:Uncharacterized protein n=1 Tax=Planoprotostelium fungivorum TaxID=1890364 RepID=A0A2P6NWT3_9EUKA|nr:hypothetical protein PROFUN_03300 [Planoprotostelium fungivorum]